ncbi:FMN-binding protein [Mesorhizobium kowhaii]|uniref:FMN-binding protein n=1 Tax=Mesorhizobium kowhaii TaxID=1300272 RepID=UPI0035EA8960
MKQIALSLIVIASSGAYVWDQSGTGPANDLIDGAQPASAIGDTLPSVIAPAVVHPVPAPAAQPKVRQQDVRQEPAPRIAPDVGKEATVVIAAAAPKPTLAASPPQVSLVPPPQPEQQSALATTSPALTETPSFAMTPAAYIPIPQPRPAYPHAPARVIRAGMKLATHGYADGVYTGPAADAYYGIIQLQALVQGGRLTALKILRYPNDRRTSVNINRQALPMNCIHPVGFVRRYGCQ